MAGLQYQKGDIFTATTQVIVNTVNCEGYMGKGLALSFKQKYPHMYSIYQEECNRGKIRIGRPSLYKESDPWILNFPTKDKWRANSKLEYLDKGLKYFVTNYKQVGIKSIAFPKLGAQNGKLSWDEVGPLMAKYLSQIDIDVYIYIAEGDHEYYADEQRESHVIAWQRFSELALSLEHLQNEIGLSSREAKKIFNVRVYKEFTSFLDIDDIEGLAKVSLKRIREYICRKQYTAQILPNMEISKSTKQQKKKTQSSKRIPKNSSESTIASSIALFSLQSHEVTR